MYNSGKLAFVATEIEMFGDGRGIYNEVVFHWRKPQIKE